MTDTDRMLDIRGALQYAACGLLVLILYWIGKQNDDNVPFFLLSLGALALGTPLLVSLYGVPAGKTRPLPLRFLVAAVLSLAGIVVTVVVAQLVPDPPHLVPTLIGLVMVVWVYLRSR